MVADVVELSGAESVKDYFPFAIVGFIFNPVLGIIAIWASFRCKKYRKQDHRSKTILYSDLTFGFSLVAIISTILILVLVYAFHYFPEHTYYDRTEIIGN